MPLAPELLGVLEQAAEQACRDADPAHDFGHVLRVCSNALRIGAAEGADVAVGEIAAPLHELFNHPKDHPESHRSGELCAERARVLLRSAECPNDWIDPSCECIRVHAFSRGLPAPTLEARVLQDADRLDAIGAIGIARCFATCSSMKRPLYALEDPFCRSRQPDDKQWGVDHFYRKLLCIVDGLHTPTARALAGERQEFMLAYLAQLERELPSG
jgi:uncharacterized protein